GVGSFVGASMTGRVMRSVVMTAACVGAPGVDSSAVQPFNRLALAIKMVPKSFIGQVKTGNDKRTRCANGNYRRAHHGRDGGNLRGGNCNPAGKAGWKSPKRAMGSKRANRELGARAV